MAPSPLPRTAFARALETLSPDERSRARRIQAVFGLREDDALWELCGLIKGFDIALRDLPTQCEAAAARTARWEVAPKGGAVISTEPGADDDGRIPLVADAAFVVATILIGTSAFTVGATLRAGTAPWAATDTLAQGGTAYLLQAIWTAPVAGVWGLVGLALVAARATFTHLRRARLASPSLR